MEVVSAEVGLHLSDHATAELHKVEAEYKAAMARISRMEAEARIGARTEELDIAIKKAKDNVRMLKGEKAEIALTADSSDLDEEIAAAEAKVKALDGKKARIDIELRGQREAARGLEDLAKREAALAAAQSRAAKQRESIAANDVRLRQRNAVMHEQERADVDKLTTAWINQSKVVEKLRRTRPPLLGKEAQAEFAHFQQEADNKLRLVEGRLRSLGARVPPLHMRVDDNMFARAKFAVQDFVNNAQKKLSSINKVRLNLGPFSGTLRTMTIAVAALGPVVTSLVGALTSLVGVLGTGLTGAVAVAGGALAGLVLNFGGVAAAIHPIISDFKIAHAATQAYTKQVLLHGAGSKQAAKAQDQMNRSLAGVDPLAADAAQRMSGLSREWSKLTLNATHRNAGMAMTAGFKTLHAILPVVAKNTNNTTAIVATSFAHMMASIRKNTGQKGGGILGSLGNSANVFLAPALRGAEHLGAALARIGESAARIFAGPAGNGFLKWAKHFDDSTKNSDKLDATIRRLGGHAADLIHLFGAAGRLITTVFNGGADSGDHMVRSMTKALDRWNSFLKSGTGHEKMAGFFDRAESGARALWSAIGPIIAAFGQWSSMLTPFTNGLLHGIGFVAKLFVGLNHILGTKSALATLGATIGVAFGVSKIAGFLGVLIRVVRLMKEAAVLAKAGRIGEAFKSLGGIGGALRGKGAGIGGQIETAGAAAGREMAAQIEAAGTAVASEIRTAMATGGTTAASEIEAGEVAGGRIAAEEMAGGSALGRGPGVVPVGTGGESKLGKVFRAGAKLLIPVGIAIELDNALNPHFLKNTIERAVHSRDVGQAIGRDIGSGISLGMSNPFKTAMAALPNTRGGLLLRTTLEIRTKGDRAAQEALTRLASTKLGQKFMDIISRGGPEAAKWLANVSKTKIGQKLLDIITRGGPGAHKLVQALSDKKIRNKVFDIIQHGGPGVQRQLEKLLGIKIRDKNFKINATAAAARGVIAGVKAAIAGIHGKTVTIATRWVNFGKQAGQAAGALFGRASGGNAMEWGGGNQELWEKQQRAMDIASARGPSQKRFGKFNRPTLLVGEEDRSEIVISTNPKYRKSNIKYLMDAARELGVTFVEAAATGRPKKKGHKGGFVGHHLAPGVKHMPYIPGAPVPHVDSQGNTVRFGTIFSDPFYHEHGGKALEGITKNPASLYGGVPPLIGDALDAVNGTGKGRTELAGRFDITTIDAIKERADTAHTKQGNAIENSHQSLLAARAAYTKATKEFNKTKTKSARNAAARRIGKADEDMRYWFWYWTHARQGGSVMSRKGKNRITFLPFSKTTDMMNDADAAAKMLHTWDTDRTNLYNDAHDYQQRAENAGTRYGQTGNTADLEEFRTATARYKKDFGKIKKMDDDAIEVAQGLQATMKDPKALNALITGLSTDEGEAEAGSLSADTTPEPGFTGVQAGQMDLTTYLSQQGVFDSSAYTTLAQERTALDTQFAQAGIGDDPAHPDTYADDLRAADRLQTFWQGVYDRINSDPSLKDSAVLGEAAGALTSAQGTYRDVFAAANPAADISTSMGLQLSAADTARQDVLAQYGSNMQGLQGLNPLTDPAGRGMGWAEMNAAMLTPDYGMLGGGSGMSTRGAGTNFGSGGGTVHLVNHFGAPPPDPHTWSQGVKFEIGAIL